MEYSVIIPKEEIEDFIEADIETPHQVELTSIQFDGPNILAKFKIIR